MKIRRNHSRGTEAFIGHCVFQISFYLYWDIWVVCEDDSSQSGDRETPVSEERGLLLWVLLLSCPARFGERVQWHWAPLAVSTEVKENFSGLSLQLQCFFYNEIVKNELTKFAMHKQWVTIYALCVRGGPFYNSAHENSVFTYFSIILQSHIQIFSHQ